MLWYGAYQSMVLTVPKCGTIFGTVVGLLYMGQGCCVSMISMYSGLLRINDFHVYGFIVFFCNSAGFPTLCSVGNLMVML